MKKGIHPEFFYISKKCSTCGKEYHLKTTKQAFKIDICSNCHPFFTGKMTGYSRSGRAELFHKKYNK